jgi:tetratricopeptide (TPR) repeat protein
LNIRDERSQAFDLHSRGEFAAAERIFMQVLEDDPRDIEVLRLSGVLALQTGRALRAEELLIQALELDGNRADTHADLGAAFMSQGRMAEALARFDEAIRLRPDHAPAHINRAGVLMSLRRHTEALGSCERAIQIWPHCVDPHLTRAAALLDLNRPGEALLSCEQGLQLQPTHPHAHFLRARALRCLGQLDQALMSYEKVVELDPMHAAAQQSIGGVLFDLRRLDQALASCNHAIALFPGAAIPYANRGAVLQDLDRTQEALESCDKAIELDPVLAAAHVHRATALNELGQLEEALAAYDRAIALEPDNARAHFGASLAHLRAGRWVRGWAEYEWRCKPGGPLPARALPKRAWTGQEDLSGKTLFIHAEQGLGDTIQFCRYVRLVSELGARVLLEVQAPLLGLLADLQGVCDLVPLGGPVPDFDYHCSLMSLPWIFETTPASIPGGVPYIKCAHAKIREWRDRVGPKGGWRVGLVWSGGFRANQPGTWSVNRRRNMSLSTLARLKHPEIEFYSLQKGEPGESELREALARSWDGPPIIDLSRSLHDFSDTAALIEQLDLLISVDTSTAHLAGALGKPVWILNRFDSCWRWLTARADTPWYPTARLYRQQKPGDWDEVVHRVRDDLARLAP